MTVWYLVLVVFGGRGVGVTTIPMQEEVACIAEARRYNEASSGYAASCTKGLLK